MPQTLKLCNYEAIRREHVKNMEMFVMCLNGTNRIIKFKESRLQVTFMSLHHVTLAKCYLL